MTDYDYYMGVRANLIKNYEWERIYPKYLCQKCLMITHMTSMERPLTWTCISCGEAKYDQ